MLPISVGCPYNRCKFCSLFKHLHYRELPLEDIEREVHRVAALGREPRHVMLGDGNAFGVPTERLLEVLDLVDRSFSDVCDASADATISSIAQKSDEELRQLRDAGLTTLYIGIESGLDDVLAFMRKEHRNDEARRQIARIHAAGMEYGAHIMCGVAGQGRGIENARATAALLNETRPFYICNFTMVAVGTTELGQDVRDGHFIPASDIETLEEEQELVRRLAIPVDFDGFTDAVGLRVMGHLPDDREKILEEIERRLHEVEDSSKKQAKIA
ncbi:MAG: radical SAM protein [Atopobiaceae bacterium]